MIPLSVPSIIGNEWKYVKDCLDTGWISSVGGYVTQFENDVAKFSETTYGVACVNGSAGLHIAMKLCGVQADDYVITANITFIATVNAIKYCNANPIFIDVDADDWQMDLNVLENFLQNETHTDNGYCIYTKTNKKIAALLCVHVLGNVCDVDRLMAICEKHNLLLLEDSTESLGSYYKGKHTGGFGKMGVFSFNGNKIISTGGGGVMVTNDEALAKKAKHITTQSKADPMEYYHDENGYNYRLVNILAAVGVAQMEQLPGFIINKKKMDAFYRKELAGVGDIVFQKVSEHVNPNCWLFTFKTSKKKELLAYLNDLQILSRSFWVPMNQLPMHKEDIYISNGDTSNKIYSSCLSIPCSVGITDAQLIEVATAIKKFYH
jgi:perosamine synthetase